MPRLVSRTWSSNSSMWIEVKRSSLTSRSQTRIASSKLYPPHGMKATSTLRAQRQLALVGRRAVGDDLALLHPLALRHDRPLVDAGVLVRAAELREVVDVQRPVVHRVGLRRLGLRPGSRRGRRPTDSTTPARRARTRAPESWPPCPRCPVPTSGASVWRSGTAWRCMFEPMRARFASSCSRNGIRRGRRRHELVRRDVHVVDLLGAPCSNSPRSRTSTRSATNLPRLSIRRWPGRC